MEHFLLRAKVTEWEHIDGNYVSRWAEGYLNLVGFTETGPKFSFAELEKGECVSYFHTRKNDERYVYKPVEHGRYLKDTVSRWTGIYDKNGKKIWEGDIVKFHMFHDEPDWIGVIKYDDPICLYMIIGEMPNNGGPFMVQVSASNKSSFEVIGNRWDNPELVKEP